MFRSTPPEDTIAGFTLIEALVALSIVAVALASIGGLVATTMRGVRSIDGRLSRLETARAVMAALPDRDQLAPGALSGTIANHAWRADVSPFAVQDLGRKTPTQWTPQAVVVSVQSPNGTEMKIGTIRLRRSDAR